MFGMKKRAGVHRTTIDIDLHALDSARAALGTAGFRDTINGALVAVGRAAELRAGGELIRAGDLNLVKPEDFERLRNRESA